MTDTATRHGAASFFSRMRPDLVGHSDFPERKALTLTLSLRRGNQLPLVLHPRQDALRREPEDHRVLVEDVLQETLGPLTYVAPRYG